MTRRYVCAANHRWDVGPDTPAWHREQCPHCGDVALTLTDAHGDTPALPASEGGVPAVAGYAVRRELGRGGMGVVFEATQLKLDRVVALKILRAADGVEARERFLREARAAARANHPGIVEVFEVGESNGVPFLAMKYFPGGGLDRLIAGGLLSVNVAARIALRIAEALDAAHRAGVVHRDLKPANILLGDPEPDGTPSPRIADFGLARRTDAPGLTRSGVLLGTPAYMAPEQIHAAESGDAVGPAADLWALGVVLYECLTGRVPFLAAGAVETMRLVLDAEPVAVRALRPEVPRDLETICHKLLHKSPDARYASAADCAADLGRFLAGEPVRARPVGTMTRAAKWVRRNPVVAALGSMTAVSVVVGLVAAVLLTRWAMDEAEAARANYASAVTNADRAELKAEEAERERAEAVKQKGIADAAAKIAKEQEGIAQREARAARVAVNAFEIESAARALRAGDDTTAGKILGGVLPEFRSTWEYRHSADWQKRRKPLIRFEKHRNEVHSLAWSPDGKLLASSDGEDAVIRAAPDFKIVHTLPKEFTSFAALAWKPTGILAVGYFDGKIRLYDGRTWKDKGTLVGHTAGIRDMAFRPGSEELFSVAEDGTARSWDVFSGKQLRAFKGHRGAVVALALSADGSRLATAGNDKTVRLWNAATGAEVRVLPTDRETIASLAFGPKDRLAVGLTHTSDPDRLVDIWDAVGGQRLSSFLGQGLSVCALRFAGPGRGRLYSGGQDGTVVVRDMIDGSEGFRLNCHADEVSRIAVSPDGRYLATGSRDKSLAVWRVPVGQDAVEVAPGNPVDSVNILLPDGGRVNAVGGNSFRRFDASSGSLLVTHAGDKMFPEVVGSDRGGDRLLVRSNAPGIFVRRISTGTVKRLFESSNVTVLSPDGSSIVVGDVRGGLTVLDGEGGLRLFADENSRKVANIQAHKASVQGVVITGDSRRAFSVAADGTVAVSDLFAGTVVARHRGKFDHSGAHLCLSADDRRAAFSVENAVYVRTAAGDDLLSLTALPSRAFCVALNADGSRLAVGYEDRSVRVYDVETGREKAALLGHTTPVVAIAFADDTLVSAAQRGDIRFWHSPP